MNSYRWLLSLFCTLSLSLSHAQLLLRDSFEADKAAPVSASLIPLSSASSPRLTFMAQQIKWYIDAPYDTRNAWLYDRRVQVLYEYYLRTGDERIHAEAKRSALTYIQHYNREGDSGNWPDCTGGSSIAGVNKCDAKYTWVSALYYLEKVDGLVKYDANLLAEIEAYLMQSGWNVRLSPVAYDTKVTERNWGTSLMGLAYLKALGSPTAADNINKVLGWLYDWQQSPNAPDTFTGAWLHSYNGHEGASGTDGRIYSPWQSAIVVGGLWRIYQVQADSRIPTMIVAFAQALEDSGYIDNVDTARQRFNNKSFPSAHRYNPTNTSLWYLAAPLDERFGVNIMTKEGWYADLHLPELQCVTAAGYYFSKDTAQKQRFKTRYEQLNGFYNELMARIESPQRLFAWQHSHNASCEWFMNNAP